MDIPNSIRYSTQQPGIEQYFQLFQTTGWYSDCPVTREDLARAITNSQFLVTAFDGEKLVGFGRIVTDFALHAMIYDLIVDPNYQNQGIGACILDQLLAFCREKDIRDIQLFCAKGKRAFYEKRGFFARSEDAPGMQYMPAFANRQEK